MRLITSLGTTVNSDDASARGKKSRNKGANGEREFIRRVTHLTDGQVNLKRNLSQSRDSGDDTGVFNVSIEVKRYKTATDAQLRSWWQQCQRNARAQSKTPVLAFRADLQSWQVVMHPNTFFNEDDVRGCVRMDIELFCQWLLHPDAFHFDQDH